MPILPDLLAPNLQLVFCGTAASDISAQARAYYANPQNAFWRTLYEIGLTPQQLQPNEFPKLLDYHIGLTDLAKEAQGTDKVLKRNDFDTLALREKILKFQPSYLAFTSKKAASIFLRKPTAKLNYGLQVEQIARTKLYLVPSPSGAARGFWDKAVWQALADCVQQAPPHES